MPRLPITGDYPPDWPEIAERTKAAAGFCCIRCHHGNDPKTGHMLTIVAADGSFHNTAWHNLVALCAKCAARTSGRLNPNEPSNSLHGDWYRPYLVGFYAKTREKTDITRREAVSRLETRKEGAL